MKFNVYLPQSCSNDQPTAGTLYWLSGLTCTEDNFMQKASIALKMASMYNLAIVCPDTSPRGLDLPGEHDDWDFGSGAGTLNQSTSFVIQIMLTRLL